MALTGTLRLTGRILGALAGPRDLDVAIPITSGVLLHQLLTLTTSQSTLTLPTGTTTVVLAPPTSNGTVWGVAASSGGPLILLALTIPTILNVGATQTALYLGTSAGTLTGLEVWCS